MKKGYTIIELIIVLAIISLISSITVINITKVKENLEMLELKHSANEVKSLLSYAKSYCRNNKVTGKITVGLDRKTITFVVSDINYKTSKTITVSKNVEVGSNFKVSSSITSSDNNITEQGYIKSAGNIKLTHKSKKTIDITISVGNDIIRSYENDYEDGDIIDEER